jgi:protoporphyrinogen oxidase
MSNTFEHIVVGGGISGLGLAHRTARRGVATLVLERSESAGGCIKSLAFTALGDFWVEAGSHTCFNSYGNLIDILADLGMLDQLIPKAKLSYFLWDGGERKSVFSALHPLEMAFSLPRLFVRKKAGQSVSTFYRAALGRRNYEDLFGPAFRAVICQDADAFPAELLFRRKPRRKEINRSFTLGGGLSDIPRAIAEQSGLEVRTGQSVVGLRRRSNGGFRLSLESGDAFDCEYLTLAVPPDVAAHLLATDMAELAALVGRIGVAEIESLALCLATEHLPHLPPLAGLIAVDDAFYSMVSRDYLPHRTWRGFSFHFRPGILSSDAQADRCCKALGIARGQIAAMEAARNRLPALRTGHADLVRRIDAALSGTRLAITGNWFLGVSIEDCLMRSQQEYERLFGR